MTAMIWSTRTPDSGAMSLAMAYREIFRGLMRAVKGTAGSAMLPTVFGASDWLGWHLERRVEKPASLPERIDGIIVLGGSIEWQISQEQGQLNLNAAAERMVAAAAMARRYPEAHVLLTSDAAYRSALAMLENPHA